MKKRSKSSRRIGITQRTDVVSTGERRDALDQRWTLFFQCLEMTVLPLPNLSYPCGPQSSDSRFDEWLDDYPISAAILSGGGTPAAPEVPPKETDPEREQLERFLLSQLPKRDMPVIGICRGFQAIVQHFGGRFRRVPGHVAVRHELSAAVCLNESPPMDANSYHNYGILPDDLPDVMIPLAWAPDKTVEAARHVDLPVFAVMWHPERENPFRAEDLSLFASFLGFGL